jgi:ABC-type glycerol-3-phosphate transport system permease component
MASIFVTMLPIMLVYPFLQKFFMKGILIGAIKS